jgi:adenylate kinase family enzyme
VNRVVVLGRGAAGKSTAAGRLGRVTGLPVIELDEHFWRPGLVATPPAEWARIQRDLASAERWIMDGDLGPYDAVGVRLERADTVLLLDFSFSRCAWRAAWRSRERADFWWWVLAWRGRSRPALLAAVRTFAPRATVHHLRTPGELERLLQSASA